MISRKITYRGNFDKEAISTMFDITRKNSITGQVHALNAQAVELNLEGDASVIKLIQHRIERSVPSISDKIVETIPQQNFVGVTFLN